MRFTRASIAACASAVLEETEGSGVQMDEETSPQDLSDNDMKTSAKKKGEGDKTTTAKKKKKDGIDNKKDGDKKRKAAFSPVKAVASTNKPPCATKGKAKKGKAKTKESPDEESEYKDDDYNQAYDGEKKWKAASSPMKVVASTNKPPCATKGKAKKGKQRRHTRNPRKRNPSMMRMMITMPLRMVIKIGRQHPPP